MPLAEEDMDSERAKGVGWDLAKFADDIRCRANLVNHLGEREIPLGIVIRVMPQPLHTNEMAGELLRRVREVADALVGAPFSGASMLQRPVGSQPSFLVPPALRLPSERISAS